MTKKKVAPSLFNQKVFYILLSIAVGLGASVEYLKAVIKGGVVKPVQGVRFCPRCWSPGSTADEPGFLTSLAVTISRS